MTQDEIIEMARQAGAHDNGYEVRFVEPKYLERFAKLVAEKKREECAKVCDDVVYLGIAAYFCAKETRARGTNENL